MRVLIAPDKFAGTLGAPAAAEAIAAGWRRGVPEDELDLAPVSDGGPGFVEVLRAATGGRWVAATVTGPLGDPVSAVLVHCSGNDPDPDDGHGGARANAGGTYGTAYIESAQACGLQHVPDRRRGGGYRRVHVPGTTTTYGVGELVARAVDDGAGHCVVGLGGSATNDGGAGLLAALGTRPAEALRGGGLGLREVPPVDLAPTRARLGHCRLVAATDVDTPLLGPQGATSVFGPQKGATRDQVAALEGALQRWAELTGPECARYPGAGAAGGLGHALFLLGAQRESGIAETARALRLAERARRADLVVTGEGSFDSQSLRGKAVSGVACTAAEQGVPCIVLAGRVRARRRRAAAAGIEAAYAVSDSARSVRAAMTHPAEELAILAEGVARARTRGGPGH